MTYRAYSGCERPEWLPDVIRTATIRRRSPASTVDADTKSKWLISFGCQISLQISSKNFNFKTAIVTGGGGGIGKALSQRLIKEIGVSAYYILDTGDISSIPKFVQEVTTAHPDVDCLINNAGVQRPLDVNNDATSDFLQKADQEIDIKIRGPVHLALELLKHFKSKPQAVVVNVGSVLGFAPFSLINPVYNGTKAFVHFWSINLREQLKGTNVHVIEIAPPAVTTDLHRETKDPNDNEKKDNVSALEVDGFVDEVLDKWKNGDELISARPGNKLVSTWEESLGKIFEQMKK